ncbi:MAG: prepilin-type N-terminal cleavage/methylation domain-containing protein [Chlamydiales bacterium]|jgi:prepilin-type N-terminal cleavage/methylation domain-containing protein
MKANAPSRAGFTLMEVVVSVMIMAMLLTSLTKLLTMVRTKRDTIHNIQENQLVGPAILDMIQRDLRGILTTNRLRSELLKVKNRIVLGQDADSIDFVTSTDNVVWTWENERALRCDYSEVGYRLRPSQESDDFLEMYRRESFGVDDDAFGGGSWTFLHDQIRNFNITVFSEDGIDAEPFEDWGSDSLDAGTEGLPAWLEISLTLELSPRLKAEALPIALVERGTVTYRRIVRFPEMLLASADDTPWLGIPTVPGEEPAEGAPGGDAGDADGEDGGDGGINGNGGISDDDGGDGGGGVRGTGGGGGGGDPGSDS